MKTATRSSPGKQAGHTDWSHAFEESLRTEMLRSEHRRITVLSSVLAFLVVLVLVITIVPGVTEEALRRKFQTALPGLLLVLIGTTVYELCMRKWIGRLIESGGHPPSALQYANVLIEVSVPTFVMLLAAKPIGPVNFLIGAAPMVYFLFVFLTTLQLNVRLCLFAGLVAGVEFAALSLWFLQSATAIPEMPMLTAPHQYVVKGLLMIVAGGVAGFVAGQIKNQFMASLRATGERDRAVSIFGQHVSPQVADKLLKQSFDFGGEVRNVVVMFLDLRDFSRFASQNTPEDVMAYLNTLFSRMIETVNRYDGIVNKFLGDGFMAVFGAPADDADQCQHALDAAMEIIREVDQMNEAGTIPPTRVGIGLHMGEAVTGNVGSSERKEYTIIGDVVNLASRIEQATKQFDGRLLISQTVWDALDQPDLGATDLGSVQLKGQAQPIRIFRLA
ncbi:MAG: adenylate/guanylate cyclase domain-containing protein [Planctomycetota bacterium]|nr:adenylate/guanylate cyclase domain-containing protein [Planctomycetota bacterium]